MKAANPWARLRRIGTLSDADDALGSAVRVRTFGAGHVAVFVAGEDVHAVRESSPAFMRAPPDGLIGVYTQRAKVRDIAADFSAWRAGRA